MAARRPVQGNSVPSISASGTAFKRVGKAVAARRPVQGNSVPSIWASGTAFKRVGKAMAARRPVQGNRAFKPGLLHGF